MGRKNGEERKVNMEKTDVWKRKVGRKERGRGGGGGEVGGEVGRSGVTRQLGGDAHARRIKNVFLPN